MRIATKIVAKYCQVFIETFKVYNVLIIFYVSRRVRNTTEEDGWTSGIAAGATSIIAKGSQV